MFHYVLFLIHKWKVSKQSFKQSFYNPWLRSFQEKGKKSNRHKHNQVQFRI
jgi:hypothetical protein